MATYRIAVLPGDGIGAEVTAEAQRVLERRGKAAGVGVRVRARRWSAAPPSTRTGTPLPAGDPRALPGTPTPSCSARWAGPSGTTCRQEQRPERGLLAHPQGARPLRQPAPGPCFPMLVDASPLKRSVVEGTDLMVIRELTGGLYFGEPRGVEEFADGGARAVNTMAYTVAGDRADGAGSPSTSRVKRRKRLTSVDKANVLVVSQLWREVVTRRGQGLSRRRSSTTCSSTTAPWRSSHEPDAVRHDRDREHLRRHPVRRGGDPRGLDGHAAVGEPRREAAVGLGSTSRSTARRPTSPGQGVANPIAAILSAGMLLRYSLDRGADADRVERRC